MRLFKPSQRFLKPSVLTSDHAESTYEKLVYSVQNSNYLIR